MNRRKFVKLLAVLPATSLLADVLSIQSSEDLCRHHFSRGIDLWMNTSSIRSNTNDQAVNQIIFEFETALGYAPDHVYIYQYLGYVYWSVGEIEKALASFQIAVREEPDCPDYHDSLASALKEVGRNKDALREFRIAEELGGSGFVVDEWFGELSKKVT